jgi:hypothetical protein
MSKYEKFIFKDYEFDPSSKVLKLFYGYDDQVEFCETYKFDFEFAQYDYQILDKAIQSLFFMAGVSYFKSYIAPNITIVKGQMNHEMSKFFSKTYKKGLGEFFFINKLDPKTKIEVPVNESKINEALEYHGNGLVVGVGGGKDSLVSIEMLRYSGQDITTWSLGHRPQLEPLINVVGLPHLWVERTWDRSILEHNAAGAYNGHVPISAILACVGTVVAVLNGKQDVLVSNENSANEADLNYDGVEINHQYSKSLEFEKDYQNYLTGNIIGTGYFSFLRPLSEVRIAEIFSKVGFAKYRGVFSSCNRAFTHESNHIFWCGECPKCAFTFLALTPFVDRVELEAIWNKNLLLDSQLESTYKQLLGIEGDKPLDCVGEIKESREAMRLAQKIYPELSKYEFDIPEDYDYKSLSSHLMPQNIFDIFQDKLNSIFSK